MKTTSKNLLYNLNRLALLGFWVLLCCSYLQGQHNYVQNPSFESITACPTTNSQIQLAYFWETGGGSPDLYNRCANANLDTWAGVPCNRNGFSCQEPKTENGYIGIAVYALNTNSPNTSHREYVKNKLKSRLIQGKSYCAKAYINMFDSSFCAIDEFGLYLDDGSNPPPPTGGPLFVNPQVKSPTGIYMMDTINWMLVSGNFIANGTEEYITLGNFRDNANTSDTVLIDLGIGFFVGMYYIDDVSVIESNLPAFAGNDTALLSMGDSVFLGREPEIGLDCVWYDMQGNPIGTGAGFWVHPTHTTSYIVEQNLCGNIKRDTVTVSLGVDIAEIAVLQGLSIAPNPSNGSFWVAAPLSEELVVQVCELNGRQVYSGEHSIKDGGFSLTLEGLAQGVYLLQVRDVRTGQRAVRRLMVE